MSIIHVEQQLLSVLLNFNTVYSRIHSQITADDFIDQTHARIFAEAIRIIQNGGVANAVTISPALSGNEHDYLAKIEYALVTASEVKEHAEIISQASARRKVEHAVDTAKKALESEHSDFEQIGGDLIQSTTQALTKSCTVESVADIAESLTFAGGDSDFYSTGIKRLDTLLNGGIFKGRLYAFGARPKMGKSTMLLTLAYNLAMQGVRVAYYTLEMDKKEVAMRILCRKANVYSSVFRGNVPAPQWAIDKVNLAKADKQSWQSLKISSMPRMSLSKMITELNAIGYGKKADVVIIDYMQLVTGKSDKISSAEHYDIVAQTMAEITKTHNLAILTAVQINRETGQVRGGDGVVNACDMLLDIKSDLNSDPRMSWLEMMATRYTAWADLGTESAPALMLDEHGPYFQET